MKRRETTTEERALFRAAVAGKIALGNPAKAGKNKIAKPVLPRKGKTEGHSGINGATRERLARGALRPDAKLDLHGLTEAAAHRALTAFLIAAANRGVHLALVVTGKGARQIDPYAPFDMELAMHERGVLKAMVPRWLYEPPLAGLIAEVSQAHIRHGGAGAFYVYLRKKPIR
jgi:DNA-nicking Smr family endonuclease